jgi:TPP-dependent pyruvate/acetoin dehydrogenase alpha subunit
MKTRGLTKKTYHSLLFTLMRIRTVEERIAELYPEQQMRCPVHLCIGEEAVAAGVCANLTKEDYVLSNHRSHAHYLAKGGNLKAMIAEVYGKATGCSKGKGGSMHLIDLAAGFLGAAPIIGSTIPITVGTAFSTQMLGEQRVSVTFLGDAATEEGVLYESLNFAALKKLPVVFVCENNLYSVYSPLSVRQPPGREIYRLAEGHGIPSFQGDGNNVVEVYEKSGEAIARARKGEGPTFLEFKTFRWREHVGPYFDNDLGYRTEKEYLEWRKRCPLETYQSYLVKEGLIKQAEIDRMTQQSKAEMDEAVAFAKASPFPDESTLMENVYCD